MLETNNQCLLLPLHAPGRQAGYFFKRFYVFHRIVCFRLDISYRSQNQQRAVVRVMHISLVL